MHENILSYLKHCGWGTKTFENIILGYQIFLPNASKTFLNAQKYLPFQYCDKNGYFLKSESKQRINWNKYQKVTIQAQDDGLDYLIDSSMFFLKKKTRTKTDCYRFKETTST